MNKTQNLSATGLEPEQDKPAEDGGYKKRIMAKVEFDPGIESVRGILMGTDPFYIRRYPARGGGVMHIVQARPDRSGHIPTAAESTARITFAEKYGRQKHLAFLERKYRGQLFLPFEEETSPDLPSREEKNRHNMPGQ